VREQDPIGLEIEYRFDSGFAIGVAGAVGILRAKAVANGIALEPFTGRYLLNLWQTESIHQPPAQWGLSPE